MCAFKITTLVYATKKYKYYKALTMRWKQERFTATSLCYRTKFVFTFSKIIHNKRHNAKQIASNCSGCHLQLQSASKLPQPCVISWQIRVHSAVRARQYINNYHTRAQSSRAAELELRNTGNEASRKLGNERTTAVGPTPRISYTTFGS